MSVRNMSTQDDKSDNKLVCEPHDGTRTPEFLIFKRNFKSAASAIYLHEDDDVLDASRPHRPRASRSYTGRACFYVMLSLPLWPISNW